MANGKPKHLPLLYNPFLNAIFNNPLHLKSPVKSTIQELSLNHNDYTILVPPAHILQDGADTNGHKLIELCYNSDEFVKSHIIKTSSAFSTTVAPITKVQLIIYNTMNGKQVLLKNGMVFTGKGFRRSVKVLILQVAHFVSFSDYFPLGSRFLVLYIDDSLYGHQLSMAVPTPIAPEVLPAKRTNTTVTFEELLRNFPILSRAMSDKFYTLFHHNNRQFQRLRSRQKVPLSEVKSEFTAMVDEAFKIVQDCVNADTVEGERTYKLLHTIVSQHTLVDLNKLVHEYVELNVYDKVWLLLVFQYQDDQEPKVTLTPLLYKDLSCLSLNQLDIPVEDPWELNILHRRVADAITQFSKLSDLGVVNQRHKAELLREAVEILTKGLGEECDIVIDADTLIGLLIMVVVHSKVPNLEAHVYYIRNFGVSHEASVDEKEDGFFNYILSNIDAVIYHLSGNGESHLQDMSAASAQNYEFWYAIQKQDLKALNDLLDAVDEKYASEPLPKHHFLRSRNIHGESCFSFAIRTKNPTVFETLLHRTEEWILIEELLFDKNTTTDQTILMVALLSENKDVTKELLEVILSSATVEEQIAYFNLPDKSGRTAGHYLSHDLDVMDAIGHLIDMTVKDLNSQTPLFSLCRCYDHSDYRSLVQKSFACALQHVTGPLTFEDHIDKAGNTLLHVLARGIPESGLLTDRALIDVNQFNGKNLSPLAIFIRYNRLENIQCLFNDNRLIFDSEEPKNFYNVLDYYSFSASKAAHGSNESFPDIERAVVLRYFKQNFPILDSVNLGVLNARYDNSIGDWIVNTVFVQPDSVSTKYISMSKLRQFTKIQKLVYPLGFGLDNDTFWMNFPSGKQTVPTYSKFRANRMLEYITLMFLAMNYHSVSSRAMFLRNFGRCCKEDSNLTFDLMKEISSIQEHAKGRMGEVKLTQQKIQEIEYFLDFSQSDLVKFQGHVMKLRKLISVGGMKQCDLKSVTDQLLQSLKLIKAGLKEFLRLDSTYLKLEPYILWLEEAVIELLKNVTKVKDKLRRWKGVYEKIREINAELHHFEGQVVHHPHNEESESLSRRSTTSLDALPVEDDADKNGSFFSFGLIENKKSRYRKLLLLKAEQVKKVMELNVDIKMDHEAIAAEISQFLTFRSGFTRLSIRIFTEAHLVLLRHRSYELSRMLHGCK